MSDQHIEALVDQAKAIIAASGITRESVGKIQQLVERAAEMPNRWTQERYPDPAPEERQARYLIRSDEDDGFTLYLNIMRPGKRIPPHNHTTWACIAAVEGVEHNTLYRRVDGGQGPGAARLEAVKEIDVKPGRGIALLPDDIHSVEIFGERPIRHLHFYGRALEVLSERLLFDTERNEARPMTMTVATKRAP
jgi:predicted metal-dependent enzyme (double-stranded beta helix superfamily)